MKKLYPDGTRQVNPELENFHGYTSAVNDVTCPDKTVWTTRYFINRWMPVLGGNGTMIVLALRSRAYFRHSTGERREKVSITLADLAGAINKSVDTVSRELGSDPKTGKFNNPWLNWFVKSSSRSFRDPAGQVRQKPNLYWVSMDDPLHPDDLPQVEAKAMAAGWRGKGDEVADKGGGPPDPQDAAPDPQDAAPDPQDAAPDPQDAASDPQDAASDPQDAASDPQDAARLKNYSSIPEIILNTTTYKETQTDVQAKGLVVDSVKIDYALEDQEVLWEEQNLEAVRCALTADVFVPPPVLMPAVPPVEARTPAVPPVQADADTAVQRAAAQLADASGLKLESLDDHISAWRDAGDEDAAIVDLLVYTTAKVGELLPHQNIRGIASGILRNQAEQRRTQRQQGGMRAKQQGGLDARIESLLASLSPVVAADLGGLRTRFEPLPEITKDEIKGSARNAILNAVGNYEDFHAIPKDKYDEIFKRMLADKFVAWEKGQARPARGITMSSLERVALLGAMPKEGAARKEGAEGHVSVGELLGGLLLC